MSSIIEKRSTVRNTIEDVFFAGLELGVQFRSCRIGDSRHHGGLSSTRTSFFYGSVSEFRTREASQFVEMALFFILEVRWEKHFIRRYSASITVPLISVVSTARYIGDDDASKSLSSTLSSSEKVKHAMKPGNRIFYGLISDNPTSFERIQRLSIPLFPLQTLIWQPGDEQ